MNGSKVRISDLQPLARPREKAKYYGINTLTDTELIALLLGSGTHEHNVLLVAQNLLNKFVNLDNISRIKDASLLYAPGIKAAKATTLLAAFELTRRINKHSYKKQEIVFSVGVIADKYQHELGRFDKEKLVLIHLNKQHKIIMEEVLYVGHARGFLLDAKEIVRRLLITDATAFVLLHNHPSDDARPSEHDLVTTHKLQQVAAQFSLKLADHIIVTKSAYFSFKEQNLL